MSTRNRPSVISAWWIETYNTTGPHHGDRTRGPLRPVAIALRTGHEVGVNSRGELFQWKFSTIFTKS